jgi:zinc protease
MRFIPGLVLGLAFTTSAFSEDFKLQEITSPHGITFSFYQSDVQNTVAVSLAFKGGVANETADQMAAGFLAPDLLTDGAGGKSAAELFESFQDYGGTFAINAGSDQTNATLSAPSKGIMGAAKLVNMVLTKPDFPEKKLLRRRESIAQRIEEINDYPEFAMQVAFSNAATELHPYQQYFNPSSAALRQVKEADLKPWVAQHLTRDGVVVSVVGDLEPAQAGLLVDDMLDGLPEKSDLQAIPKMVFKAAPPQAIKVNMQTGDQALISIGTALPFSFKLDDWMGGYMLSQIFCGDQKSRLFKDVRESTGNTYGLQSSMSFYEAELMNGVAGRVAKAEVEQTVQLVKKSWDHFRQTGPSDDEIKNAKATMGRYFADLRRNHTAMAQFVRDYRTGHWTTAQIASLPSITENVNLKDPSNLARLFPENPIVVIAQ